MKVDTPPSNFQMLSLQSELDLCEQNHGLGQVLIH